MTISKKKQEIKTRRSNVQKIHATGLTNRQIAKKIGVSHRTISNDLKVLGLSTNGSKRGTLKIKNNKGKCSKCGEWKDLDTNFHTQRSGSKYEYRLTSCNSCRLNQYNQWCNDNPEAFWKRRYTAWKKKAKEKHCRFTISLKYIQSIYSKQEGRCFYTGEVLHMKLGKGLLDNCMSIDKVVPEKGYIEGNIVLCTRRFNTIKNNMSLDEMKIWMPGMFNKLISNDDLIISKGYDFA